MAAIEDIRQEFVCPICADLFTVPKGLPCLHSFCRDCLQAFLVTQEKQVWRQGFKCPVCRMLTKVPDPAKLMSQWADQFPTNYHISSIMEIAVPKSVYPKCKICAFGCKDQRATSYCPVCQENYCEDCARLHSLIKVTKTHKLKKLLSKEQSAKLARRVKHTKSRYDSNYEITAVNGVSYPIQSDTDDEKCNVTGALFLVDDRIIVCDNANRKIKLISASGNILGEEENFNPFDVTCISQNEVAVAEEDLLRFFKVRSNVLQLQKAYSTDWRIYVPKTLTILESKSYRGISYGTGFYVVCCNDDDNKHVVIKDREETFTRRISHDDIGGRIFLDPWYCAVDPISGDVFVSDSLGQRGKVICISKRGSVKWTRPVSMPRGLCVFGEHLFVADLKEDSVQVFNLSGDFVKTILTQDDGIRRPQAVAINNTGDKLLVTMAPPYHSECIKVFELSYRSMSKKDGGNSAGSTKSDICVIS